MQARLFTTLAAAIFATAATAQVAIWSPNGYAAVAGNSNNAFPWNWGGTPMHYLQVYGSQNFTLQGISGSAVITRLRFRTSVYPTTTSWSGGTWPNVIINLSTAAVTYSGISATFASNHGPDLTNVYTGPVTVMPGTGNGTGVPGPVYIDIALTTPFVYTPANGDLCLEVVNSATGWSGTSTQCEAIQGTGAGGPVMCRRVYNTSSSTAASGGVDGFDYGLATEFSYLPPSGTAYYLAYGTGCSGLALTASARPVIGTSINLVTSGIPAGTPLGADILSSTQYNPGIDLGAIGMPGCRQYVGLDSTMVFVVTGATASVPLGVPNIPALAGVRVQCQSATFSSGINALGVIASNGLTLVLDLQ
jgi:hypothetical protein